MTPEAFVDHVRDTYVLSPGSEQLLERTDACLRRYDGLMATLAVEDHYHLSARGRLQPHPALASVREETTLLARLLRQLNLES